MISIAGTIFHRTPDNITHPVAIFTVAINDRNLMRKYENEC